MTEIRLITASEWIDQAEPLMLAHWREVAEATGVPPPNIDRALLAALEAANNIFCLGLLESEQLVGYSINIMGPTFDFANLRVCQNEGLYVDQAHRGRTSLRLIEATDQTAAQFGCKRIMWHTYTASRAHALFTRLGYRAHDVIFTRELPCQPESRFQPSQPHLLAPPAPQ